MRIALIGLVATSLLLAPACGDGDDDSAGTSEIPQATDAADTEQADNDSSLGGSDSGYTEGFQSQFVSRCVAGTATEEQCECILDYFIENVPYDEYVAVDEGMRAGEIGVDDIPEWLTNAQSTCGIEP